MSQTIDQILNQFWNLKKQEKQKVYAISIESFAECSNLTNVIWPNYNNPNSELTIRENAFSKTNINDISISNLANKKFIVYQTKLSLITLI